MNAKKNIGITNISNKIVRLKMLPATFFHKKFFKNPAKENIYLFHFVTLNKLYSSFKYKPFGAVRFIELYS
ncbi:MAG: hypothetical protein LH615_06095, partial [Ferruginibacter sp.]|nr:hypothetical protein [Ferruginibacter sp.]